MRSLYLIALIAFTAILNCEAKVIPDSFFGTFKLYKDENFDEYLKARGFGWIMRLIIRNAGVTKIIRRASSGNPNKYDFENQTTKKDTFYHDFELGKEFQNEGLDSTPHKILFDMKDSNTLTERHIKVNEPDDVETYEYTMKGGELVMKMTWNGVTTYRYYKRI